MSLPHDAAHTHVTGESEYIDDRPLQKGELHVGVFYSSEGHARIKKLDLSAALAYPGVVAIYTARDLHHNRWGTIFQDQPLLAEEEVQFAGEPIAIIAAQEKWALYEARKKIKIQYELLPPILSIGEAIEKKSFIGENRRIERGDVKQALAQAPHRLKGKTIIHGADHFYLESQASVAYPRDDGTLEVHSSSQHPTETQHVVAHALGLPAMDVTCIVKRMGGGFGGKESQAAPFAAFAALVAHRLKRPARIILTKDDDMIMTGKRNPFENDYEVGFDDDGKIHALRVSLHSDGGAYADLSTSIMERAMLHCDNAYFIPHVSITGQVCRTHFHPHTAFRGFGGPKGIATIEQIIEEIAHTLKKDALDIRKLNCYRDQDGRNVTHYNQIVENNCLPELFDSLETSSDYRSRRQEIESHNQEALKHSRPKTLRGLSLTAVKFGISFTTRFLNQGNALVIIHKDGSLQVSTGATEMGQGVNARIAQLVAEELGLPRSHVRMMPTSTDKNANTSPTAASSGTDINGSAAVLAARTIKIRLCKVATRLLEISEDRWAKKTAGLGTEPEIELKPVAPLLDPNARPDFSDIEFEGGFVFHRTDPRRKISFSELVHEAYLNRISLSEYSHYRIPDLTFNKLKGEGRAFMYFTQGVAASEVALSLVTGEAKVLRTDILMDLGRPINPGLDEGQVTGAFVQGMGWVTTENLFYAKKTGLLLSHSPSTYKIPNIQDTPRIFNVALLANDRNYANIRGTKAVGEPPLLLALSVWTAIQDALKGLPPYRAAFPRLQIPATQEVILRAMMPEEFSKWE